MRIRGEASGTADDGGRRRRARRLPDQPHRLRHPACGRGRGRTHEPRPQRRQRAKNPSSRCASAPTSRPSTSARSPTRPRRGSPAPSRWKATPSRWRTSATGPTPRSRPMCGRSPSRAPMSSPRVRPTASASPSASKASAPTHGVAGQNSARLSLGAPIGRMPAIALFVDDVRPRQVCRPKTRRKS